MRQQDACGFGAMGFGVAARTYCIAGAVAGTEFVDL